MGSFTMNTNAYDNRGEKTSRRLLDYSSSIATNPQQEIDDLVLSQADAWGHAYKGLAERFKKLDEDKKEFPTIESKLTITDILLEDIGDVFFYIKKYIKERRCSPLDRYNLKCLEQVK